MSLDRALEAELSSLSRRNLLRALRAVEGPQGPEISIDGRTVICLCSNDYLGLASDPELVAAARAALDEEGVGAGASRLISGNMRSHRLLEERLATFLRTPAAISFATGYAANVGTLQALTGPDDVLFSDALNHASLIDGCRLSRARVVVYPHGDTNRLAELLAAERPSARRALVVTDAVFSMDGDRAPLARLRALCDAADAWLMVDEAHALGVLGPGGRGLSAAAGVRPEILMGTLGKALGSAGAFVAGGSKLIRYLQNCARSFVFSTAPPPAVAAAARRAIDLAEEGDALRARLLGHAARLREGLRAQGWTTGGEDTPIVPVRVGRPDTAMAVSESLLARGVYANGIRPPTVPEGTARIRLVPTAAHGDHHIDRALEAFAAVRTELLAELRR